MRGSWLKLRLTGGVVALLVMAGCASYRGALLYKSGSEALESGDAELAIERLQEAAELVPQASEIQNHLGLAYAAAGRDGRALYAFRRAVELDCDNTAAVANLAAAEAQQAERPGRSTRSEPLASEVRNGEP